MNFRTKQFLRKRFGEYYQTSGLILPPDFTRREWGFIFFDELPNVVMRRHKSFSVEGEALEYIRVMAPAHVYHSAAYYQFPGAGTMKEKLWQGADLIFDLDADHLPMKARSYAEMLSNVKSEAVKLLDFLLEDFGFSENNISIVFSGGRGYHIHVRDPKVLMLEGAERREIVDYVGGTGFDYNSVLNKRKKKLMIHDDHGIVRPERTTEYEMTDLPRWGRRATQRYIRGNLLLPQVEMPTWGKRVAEQTIKFLDKIRLLEYKEALEELKKIEGITPYKAKNILKSLQSFESYDKLRKTIFNAGLDQNSSMWNVQQSITKNVGIKAVEGETDEPVTADTKRLIRMSSSLHGGSGMRVVPLTSTEFEKFEPLNDAVVFSEKEIKIEIIPPLKPQNSLVEIKGKSFRVEEGINTLPEYAAIYLMCRGAAEYA